jgi:cell division protein FtsB
MPTTQDDDPTVERRSPLTGRAVVLLLVVAALVVSSVVPMRTFFEQRADLAALRAQTAEQQARVAALEAQQLRWDDPAYVEAQARTRLHFVMPGEVGYVVLEPDEAPDPETARAQQEAASTDPWYSTLWGSVQAADAVEDPAASAEPPTVRDPESKPKNQKKSTKKSDGAGD